MYSDDSFSLVKQSVFDVNSDNWSCIILRNNFNQHACHYPNKNLHSTKYLIF